MANHLKKAGHVYKIHMKGLWLLFTETMPMAEKTSNHTLANSAAGNGWNT